jgi:hypothetical protein
MWLTLHCRKEVQQTRGVLDVPIDVFGQVEV